MGRRLFAVLLCLSLLAPVARAEPSDKLTITQDMGVFDLTPYRENHTLLRIVLDGGSVANAQALSKQTARPRVTLKNADVKSAAALLTALKDEYFELSIEDMALEGELLTALCECHKLNWLSLKSVTLESFAPLKSLKTVTDVILDACQIADTASIKVLGTFKYLNFFTLTIKRFPLGTDYSGLYRLAHELDFVTVIGYEAQAPFDLKKVRARTVRYIPIPQEN